MPTYVIVNTRSSGPVALRRRWEAPNISPAKSEHSSLENTLIPRRSCRNLPVIGPEKSNIIGNLKTIGVIVFDFLV